MTRVGARLVRGLDHIRTSIDAARAEMWRARLQGVGPGCSIHPNLVCRAPEKVLLASDVLIREYVVLNGRSDRPVGIYLGKAASLRPFTHIDCYGGEGHVYVDDYAMIGQHVIIGGNGGVHIGRHSMVSGLTSIQSATHHYDAHQAEPYRLQGETRRGVHIGNNVWIGSHCMILDGVVIGDGAVVGAGSVVARSIPSRVLAWGTPARPIRELGGA